MLGCKCCMATFEEGEVSVRRNVYGTTSLFNDLAEVVGLCPYCQSDDIIVASECKICKHEFADVDGIGICECCLEEEETIDLALSVGDDSRLDIEVNGFVASALSADKINEILIEYVKKNFEDKCISVTDYLETDKKALSDIILEKRGE